MPKTANAFCMNSASTTKFSSVMTFAIHIWVNLLSLHKVLTRLLMYNNSQSMVPFSYSDHQLLLSMSTFANYCHFLNVTIEDTNVIPVIMTLWPIHISIHDITTKYPKLPCLLEDFRFVTYFTKHVSFTWQPQKSL
jgi:hypothetical protein